MKKRILFALLTITAFSPVFLQGKLNIDNAVIVGLFDKKDDRFQAEILIAEKFIDAGIKTTLSLNYLKEGTNASALASDSVREKMLEAGYDTYVLVAVRGYDSKFKPASNWLPLEEELSLGHLFPMFREEVSNVTYEFKVYKGTNMIGYDSIKISSPSKEKMIKRLGKELEKRIKKNW